MNSAPDDIDELFAKLDAQTHERRRRQFEKQHGPGSYARSLSAPRQEILEMFNELEHYEGKSWDPVARATIWRSPRPDGELSWYDIEERRAQVVLRSPLGLECRSDFTWEGWRRVLVAFDWRCAYCGVDGELSQDHVIPLSKGGHDLLANLLPACLPCNLSKGKKNLHAWLKHRGAAFTRAARERITKGLAKLGRAA